MSAVEGATAGSTFGPWGTAIGAGIGGLASFFGGERGNRASAREAQRNRDFQERMSSTSHQREVKDLYAAGLNPILSANKGASTPGGSMATQHDTATPAIATAREAARTAQEIQNLLEAQKKTKQETLNLQQDNNIKKPLEKAALGNMSAIDLATTTLSNALEDVPNAAQRVLEYAKNETTEGIASAAAGVRQKFEQIMPVNTPAEKLRSQWQRERVEIAKLYEEIQRRKQSMKSNAPRRRDY